MEQFKDGVGVLTRDDAIGRYVTCTLDGVDISRDCIAASDRQGWALVWSRGLFGQHVARADKLGLQVEIKLGRVRFQFKTCTTEYFAGMSIA